MLARSRNVLEITLSYFTLKKHEAAKSDAWKYFSLLFEKQGADSGSLTEVKYLCVCNACKRVYAYKAFDGSGFGDMQFATDYNGITYVMNALSMRVGSGRQFRVHDGSGPEKSDPWSTLGCLLWFCADGLFPVFYIRRTLCSLRHSLS